MTLHLRKDQTARLALLAGLLPILTVNGAYLLNVYTAGLESCFPYIEGCMSVSRGVRSGPGLLLFRVLAVPSVLCMAATWLALPGSLRQERGTWIGVTGAVFLLVYAFTLGTEGELYRWMRRYGVVFYFGLTGLAQLMLAARLWRPDMARESHAGRVYLAVICATWLAGVLSAFKRQLVDNPVIVDRLESALEWNFALGLSLTFIAMAPVIRRAD